MKHAIIFKNDFGEVAIDHEAREAIEMIVDMAYSLQMTAAEFISEFENGVPECPHCVAQKH